MALTDLLHSELEPAPAPPPGITCENYAPGDGPRCGSYLPNGACARPDEFMCVEWMKHNAHRTVVPDTAPAAPAVDAPPAIRPGSLLTRHDVEAFRSLGAEIEVRSPLGTFWLVPARTGHRRLELLPEELVAVVNVVQVFGGRIVALTRDGRPLADADSSVLASELSDDADPVRDVSAATADGLATDARMHLRQLRASVAGPAQQSLFGGAGACDR